MNENNLSENEPIFSIGVAAKKLGIAVPTLRMYEKAGLVLPYRTPTGRRLYSFFDLRRISYIRRLIKKEGLNLAGIRRLMALLPCWQLKPCTPEMRETCPAYVDCKTVCWIFPDTSCCNESDRNCRECPVYLNSTETTERLTGCIR